ncbi:hypothetical protein JW721_02015 [Candidatus Micrarchaeota archaeon]|nr:hypothetical protein [Candidatus Micrarchaeota archaeon]
MMSTVDEKTNSAFKETCRILFKEEIGELSAFEDYLKEYMFPYAIRKSCVSGREVMIGAMYPEGAKIVSHQEMPQLQFTKVDVNKIKDIDSLLEAVGENIVYCGNRVFGSTAKVERVDNAIDCINLSNSHNVSGCKDGAFLSHTRENDHCFGTSSYSKSKFVMRSYMGFCSSRCFEAVLIGWSSDCVMCFNCMDTHEAMFSFNLRGKRHAIGNLELPREKYLPLREKLLLEIAQKLRKDKKFVGIGELPLIYGGLKDQPKESGAEQEPGEGVEAAFGTLSKIVLGSELGPMKDYEGWMKKYPFGIVSVKGALGTPTLATTGKVVYSKIPVSRCVTQKEALEMGKKKISIEGNEALGEIMKKASEIAYYTFEYDSGGNESAYSCPLSYKSRNVYKIAESVESKNSALGCMVFECEFVFGSHLKMQNSKFCLNCCDCANVANCFETDSSYNSTNCYFCHNCENVENGIFCFNTKGKRYAVGNTEVGPQEFARIKKILLDYVLESLGEKKTCELGIFSVASPGRGANP